MSDRATETRVDEVEDRLVTAVAVGEYLPGANLPPERELAGLLGVARVTVRGAIARLVERGLLETRRGRGGGTFVRTEWPDNSSVAVGRVLLARWEAIQDTADAIALLHGALATAAAERVTPEDAALIRARLEVFRDATSGLEKQQADAVLHRTIIDAARNDALRTALAGLESQISIAAPAHLWGTAEGMAEMETRALHEHESLVDAVCSGRAPEAGVIARQHVGIDVELLERAVRRTGQVPRH
ncbi:GntR family transcriptional regulator [Curtobacterium flaccumfaciens pv. betae]|uniref:FadR/GntR family transcriptional regulator n=1 Tax=Curtobacterium flaccumfaciens TaxID=2035 RepID=UPI002658DAA8|nr:GntR family transcriptional regulator [Curtobacterium flaccumfaciens]MCS5505444.1 GntR family transcriptional regulator [Curtobacterium flaccumfaciens pv. flaccumfaciens]MCS5512825.1 GntR family transcriptional regulator [Curtobacterium flaccumfaciens pv. betae]